MPRILLVTALALGPASGARAATGDITAVSARASDSYKRAKLPEGTYATEYYAFAEGGRWAGAVSDPSLDSMKFLDVARAIAGPLQEQNYLPSRDPKATRLLVVVYWGGTGSAAAARKSAVMAAVQSANSAVADAKSANAQRQIANQNPTAGIAKSEMICGHIVPTSSNEQIADQAAADNAATGEYALLSAQNRARDQEDARFASMLGFGRELNATANMAGTPFALRREGVVREIEEPRYFVVLMAYDFQKMWKDKKHELLWETRLSVPQQGKDFYAYLLAMTRRASPYFGRSSNGIERLDLPAGRVEVGDVHSLGVVSAQ